MGRPTCFPAWKALPSSGVSSPAASVPGVWEVLRYFLNEQSQLNFAFVFTFNFSSVVFIFSFFWHGIVFRNFSSESYISFLVNTLNYMVSLDEGGGVSVLIPTPGFTMVFILQITTPVQRGKGSPTDSAERTDPGIAKCLWKSWKILRFNPTYFVLSSLGAFGLPW